MPTDQPAPAKWAMERARGIKCPVCLSPLGSYGTCQYLVHSAYVRAVARELETVANEERLGARKEYGDYVSPGTWTLLRDERDRLRAENERLTGYAGAIEGQSALAHDQHEADRAALVGRIAEALANKTSDAMFQEAHATTNKQLQGGTWVSAAKIASTVLRVINVAEIRAIVAEAAKEKP